MVMHSLRCDGSSRRRPPGYPSSIEQLYREALERRAAMVHRLYDARITKTLNAQRRPSETRQDSEEEDIQAVITAMLSLREFIREQFAPDEEDIRDLALKLQLRTLDYTDKKLARVARVSVLPPYVGGPDVIDAFIRENVALIKTIDERYHDEVAKLMERGIREGLSNRELTRLLDEGFRDAGKLSPVDGAKYNGERIARNQMHRLNGQISRLRKQQLGVRQYRWRNMKDVRVTGNPGGKYPDATPSHWDLDGKLFDYAGRGHPIDGHPGQRPGCRCFDDPVLETDSKERLQAYDKNTMESAERRRQANAALLGLPGDHKVPLTL